MGRGRSSDFLDLQVLVLVGFAGVLVGFPRVLVGFAGVFVGFAGVFAGFAGVPVDWRRGEVAVL